MKTKEFIAKYKTEEKGLKFDHEGFVNDLADDFKARLDYYTKMKDELTYKHFKTSITEIRSKFDSIVIKSQGDQDRWAKLWNFFFAAVVVPERTKQFPDWKAPKKRPKKKESIELGSFAAIMERAAAIKFLRDHHNAKEV